jgi:hypothetical protein
MSRGLLALLLTAASPYAASAQSTLGAAWDSVGSTLQAPGTLTGGYHRYNLPRRDITLRMGDVTVSPSLALGAWAGFGGASDPRSARIVRRDTVVDDPRRMDRLTDGDGGRATRPASPRRRRPASRSGEPLRLPERRSLRASPLGRV